LIKQRSDQSTGDRRRAIKELCFVNSARHRRSERARRVHRCAGEWPDRENVGGNDEPDSEAANLRPAQIDGSAEDHEHQEERSDRLEYERLSAADLERDALPPATCGRKDSAGKARLKGITCDDCTQQLSHE